MVVTGEWSPHSYLSLQALSVYFLSPSRWGIGVREQFVRPLVASQTQPTATEYKEENMNLVA